MASVELDTVWLNLAADPAQSITLEVSSLDDDEGLSGEVRTYAGGRQRSITRAGRQRKIDLAFDLHENRAALVTLRAWAGQPVLFRDPFGRKVWAVFYRVPVSERVPVDFPEGSLTLIGITVPEYV